MNLLHLCLLYVEDKKTYVCLPCLSNRDSLRYFNKSKSNDFLQATDSRTGRLIESGPNDVDPLLETEFIPTAKPQHPPIARTFLNLHFCYNNLIHGK